MSYGGDNRGPLLNVIDWVFNSVALGMLCTSDIDQIFVSMRYRFPQIC